MGFVECHDAAGMACATSDQHISNDVPLVALCEKLWVVQKLVGLSTLLFFIQFKFVRDKLKTQVTSASTEFAMTNDDRLTEFTESFLLVYRYLVFDNGWCLQFVTEVVTFWNRMCSVCVNAQITCLSVWHRKLFLCVNCFHTLLHSFIPHTNNYFYSISY